ncbi:hypothetical protein [Kluyvera ascorbata]
MSVTTIALKVPHADWCWRPPYGDLPHLNACILNQRAAILPT